MSAGGFFQVTPAEANFDNSAVIMSVGHLPPYAPVATALNNSAGSDCGSSSGLGKVAFGSFRMKSKSYVP